MNPASPDHQPGFELPQPASSEALPAMPAPGEKPLQAEQASKQAELPGSAVPPMPVSTAPSANPVMPTAAIPTNPAAPMATSSTDEPPAIADDVDLIEKEWVDKAKAIVERTREDPHQQNKQLNQFKADYMKKRYGKEAPLKDE